MNIFNRGLSKEAKFFEELYKPLEAKKRLLIIDYKKNGVNYHFDAVIFPSSGMSDKAIVKNILRKYPDKKIISIGEVNEQNRPIGFLYATKEVSEKKQHLENTERGKKDE